MKTPEHIIDIIKTLKNKGHNTFIVGGAVRDHYIKKITYDYDLTTSALPHQIESYFNKTIATGKRFGTITVIAKKHKIEITTMREESDYSNSRHPSKITYTDNILKDLKRRDFTMNAIAFNPITQQFIDPYNGVNDINNKTIRIVGEPLTKMKEDSLRIIRAARFTAQLGFTIEPESYSSIKKVSQSIILPSYERITEEIKKILSAQNYKQALDILLDWGIINKIYGAEQIPEIKNTDDYLQKLAKIISGSTQNHNDILNRIKLTKKDKNTISALIKNNFDYYKVNINPKSLKISGKELIRMGFENKKIGTIQKELVKQVKSGMIPNIKSNLISYIISNYSESDDS